MPTRSITRRDMIKSTFAASLGLRTTNFANSVDFSSKDDQRVIIFAGSFENPGGWMLDTQFMEIMGLPYLMAHGLGSPVPDATTIVRFPQTGIWHVWVHTKDWVARWNAPGTPGRFQLLIDKSPLKVTFGTEGENWHWQDGGIVEINKPTVTLSLHDLTGFNGRCDAIYFTKDLLNNPLPNEYRALLQWRQGQQDATGPENVFASFDLVIAGGGYAGMCTAISAARMGMKVALVQNRPVFGGNASSEIRVPLRGLIPKDGPYAKLGNIVYELQFDKLVEARQAVEKDDLKYEEILRAEKNITLFPNHYAYAVEMDKNSITGILILDTQKCSSKLVRGHLFADCTGHATIGALAGADYMIGAFAGSDFTMSKETPLMGMTNKWLWELHSTPQCFPEIPWALDLSMEDFPLHRSGHWGDWQWESGFYHHPIDDLESIRDWNFRAVFGAWNAVKNKGNSPEYRNARLVGLSAIGGLRESRRLCGDYVLTAADMINRVHFDDGFVPVSWYIDRHIPHPQYNSKYPQDPFIATGWNKIKHENRPRHGNPWWGIPYRCLYSRNVANLFMAGRNISTDYLALGPVRVMRTCGMMGEVIGKAALLCADKGCQPRDVYHVYLDKLKRFFN